MFNISSSYLFVTVHKTKNPLKYQYSNNQGNGLPEKPTAHQAGSPYKSFIIKHTQPMTDAYMDVYTLCQCATCSICPGQSSVHPLRISIFAAAAAAADASAACSLSITGTGRRARDGTSVARKSSNWAVEATSRDPVEAGMLPRGTETSMGSQLRENVRWLRLQSRWVASY